MPTVLHRLARWADSSPDAPAQRYKEKGVWKTITAREFSDAVYHLALYFESQGITAKDGGCIYSANCPQWVHVDLATLLMGARSAGIYPNSTPKEIVYVLEHSDASLLSVQNKDFFKKMLGEKNEVALPKKIKRIISFDNDASFHENAVTYKAALAEGARLASHPGAKKLTDYLGAIDPHAGCFMIYTSGTTGTPKGALLSHDNFTFTADAVAKTWDFRMEDCDLFSFLPLCHVAEKLQNVAVGISQHYAVNFATKFDNVSKELPEVQPQLLLCVPRLWEKMMEGVLDKVSRSPAPRRALAHWALGVGARIADAKFARKLPNPLDHIQYKLADKLVLSKIRFALGLSRGETLASGAATLPAHVSKWFRSLGLELLEDFGQTESTGVMCMTQRGVESAGTVGKPMVGMEVKIAEDGELITRGRHVFKGYFKDQKSTDATVIDGWLHTGDLAEMTDKGLIRIKGRKKEIMKTSGGKMVAPGPLEEKLKQASEISQVCIVGDGRKYLSALFTLSEGFQADLKAGGRLPTAGAVTDKEVIGKVKAVVDTLNKELASYEQIKRFTVLAREFSIEDGEMTPTLKMKRNVVEARYKDLIEQMYAGGAG
jgi:long-chain acyl-CoA synthetase